MKVYVDGAEVRLAKRNYVGQGGEGAVYSKGTTAYKIYSDPRKMIPVGKIGELSAIQDNRIVRPLAVVKNRKGTPVGYTMQYCRTAYTLCQLFPRAFRDREGLDFQAVQHLVREMQEGIEGVHAARVLIVDLNEMNFLVTKDFGQLYFIDVDSYQTKSFPATALMESVRDRHMKGPRAFSRLTDWFAFAIVSFQLWCGIHPYKGKHKLKGLDARMRANVSVFSSEVKVPKVAYPVDVIPQQYRDWYRAVLADGKRAAPPTEIGAVVMLVPDVKAITGTDLLDITEVLRGAAPIRGYWSSGQHYAVMSDTVLLDGRRRPGPRDVAAVAYSAMRSKAVAVHRGVQLQNLTDQQPIPFQLEPDALMAYDGRVYLKVRDGVHELLLTEVGTQVVASTRLACSVLEKATQLYPGVVLQNLLGTAHVSVFPASGQTYQSQVKELQGYRVVDARYDRRVLMVVGEKSGQYDRLVFRFDEQHQSYDVRIVEDVTPTGLNFVVLDSGVAVCLNEDEKLEVFQRSLAANRIKIVGDPVLGNMTLVRHLGQLGFYRGNGLYRMSLKGS